MFPIKYTSLIFIQVERPTRAQRRGSAGVAVLASQLAMGKPSMACVSCRLFALFDAYFLCYCPNLVICCPNLVAYSLFSLVLVFASRLFVSSA